jgi:hypothetical protein
MASAARRARAAGLNSARGADGSASPTPDPRSPPRPGHLGALIATLPLVLLGATLATLGSPGAWPPAPVRCMAPLSDRAAAFRSTVVFNLGEAGADPRLNCRTAIPTLASFAPIWALATRLGLHIEAWLYDDRAVCPLEACQGRWRPAIGALAFDPGRLAASPRLRPRWLPSTSLFALWNGLSGPGPST